MTIASIQLGTNDLDSITYNLRSQPVRIDYASGAYETYTYYAERGWVEEIDIFDETDTQLSRSKYTFRTSSGKIARTSPTRVKGRYDYCYDYAGRLSVAAELHAQPGTVTCANVDTWSPSSAEEQDVLFAYEPDGSLKTLTDSTAAVTTYDYGSSPVAHAPHRIAGGDIFAYGANGNQTTGLGGKTMAYDGENRPLSVTMANNDTTDYVYGAEGQRLTRVETESSTATTALYLGDAVEIVNPGASEVVHWYLPGNVRHTDPGGTVERHVMHRDQLSSTVMITDANADWGLERAYAPFGTDREWTNASAVDPLPEDIGFIGERKDAVSGLHYLNARYFDPTLRMFIHAQDQRAGGNKYELGFHMTKEAYSLARLHSTTVHTSAPSERRYTKTHYVLPRFLPMVTGSLTSWNLRQPPTSSKDLTGNDAVLSRAAKHRINQDYWSSVIGRGGSNS